MSAGERLKDWLHDEVLEGFDEPLARALIAVVEAAEQLKAAEAAQDVQRLVQAGLALGETLAALEEALER